jgi:hypothetical protein
LTGPGLRSVEGGTKDELMPSTGAYQRIEFHSMCRYNARDLRLHATRAKSTPHPGIKWTTLAFLYPRTLTVDRHGAGTLCIHALRCTRGYCVAFNDGCPYTCALWSPSINNGDTDPGCDCPNVDSGYELRHLCSSTCHAGLKLGPCNPAVSRRPQHCSEEPWRTRPGLGRHSRCSRSNLGKQLQV